MNGLRRALFVFLLAAFCSLPRAFRAYGQNETEAQTGQSLGLPDSVPGVAAPLAPLPLQDALSAAPFDLNGLGGAGEIPALPLAVTLPRPAAENGALSAPAQVSVTATASPVQALPQAEQASASSFLAAPESAPRSVLPSEPATAAGAANRAEERSPHKTLLQTLSAPMPDFSKSGDANAAADAAMDFTNRAQLGGENVGIPAENTVPNAEFGDLDKGQFIAAHQNGNLATIFDYERELSAPQSIGWMAQAERNWYFRAIENNPAAVAELKSRLTRDPVPYGLLESEIAAEAARHGVKISRIDSVYRYGSSVWGPKGNPPGDIDLLVIAEGIASEVGKSEGESLSAVDENDPASFVLHWSDEKDAGGRLPLNVTVISRKYIQNYAGPDNRPKGLDATVLGELSGDWGHGVLVYGDDALAGLNPSPLSIVRGAEMMNNNAGRFMENYIFGDDPSKPQAMGSMPRAGTVSKEDNAKLIPKMYLRLLEVRLRLAAALTRAGKPAELGDKVLGDPGPAFARYFTGTAWPKLPKVDNKMAETVIRMHNQSPKLISITAKTLMEPKETAAQTWRQWLAAGVGLLAAAGFAALLFLH